MMWLLHNLQVFVAPSISYSLQTRFNVKVFCVHYLFTLCKNVFIVGAINFLPMNRMSRIRFSILALEHFPVFKYCDEQ